MKNIQIFDRIRIFVCLIFLSFIFRGMHSDILLYHFSQQYIIVYADCYSSVNIFDCLFVYRISQEISHRENHLQYWLPWHDFSIMTLFNEKPVFGLDKPTISAKSHFWCPKYRGWGVTDFGYSPKKTLFYLLPNSNLVSESLEV